MNTDNNPDFRPDGILIKEYNWFDDDQKMFKVWNSNSTLHYIEPGGDKVIGNTFDVNSSIPEYTMVFSTWRTIEDDFFTKYFDKSYPFSLKSSMIEGADISKVKILLESVNVSYNDDIYRVGKFSLRNNSLELDKHTKNYKLNIGQGEKWP